MNSSYNSLQLVMYQPQETARARVSEWLVNTLSRLFGPIPGSQAHVDLFFDTVRLLSEERRRPEGQRNEARLLQLTKQKLRLEAERSQVSKGYACFPCGRQALKPAQGD